MGIRKTRNKSISHQAMYVIATVYGHMAAIRYLLYNKVMTNCSTDESIITLKQTYSICFNWVEIVMYINYSIAYLFSRNVAFFLRWLICQHLLGRLCYFKGANSATNMSCFPTA